MTAASDRWQSLLGHALRANVKGEANLTLIRRGEPLAFRKKAKKDHLPPPPGGLPLPPPPGAMPSPPPLPDEPLVTEDAENDDDPQAESIEKVDSDVVDDEDDISIEIVEDDAGEKSYSDLWEKRSEKTLPQMYGHIDRLGSGEVGTLLERYSDRFGHELDREIIVMRKQEREAVRETTPLVEIISTPDEEAYDEDEGEEHVEEEHVDESDLEPQLESRIRAKLADIEKKMRPLQQKFKLAKQRQQHSKVKKFGGQLKPLVVQRKKLKAVLSGEAPPSSLKAKKEVKPESEPVTSADDEGDEDRFEEFFGMVNNLLGEMPDEFVNAFVQTKNFQFFQKVGEDPAGSNQRERKRFFIMVNKELGDMPEDMLQKFSESPEFGLFLEMGQIYG